jgi:phosphoribosylaminoimidazolecarboxamide formyltransferase / IMP cyclohydrolase
MNYNNNSVDADAAWRAAWDFAPDITVAICKHNNPCGLAADDSVAEAYLKAHECGPMNAYAALIATNSTVTLEMAQNLLPVFTEVIVAPGYDSCTVVLLKTHKKNLRILRVFQSERKPLQFRQIDGGVLVQSKDPIDVQGDNITNWHLAAGDPVDKDTMRDLVLAWKAVRCVKSNAVLLA